MHIYTKYGIIWLRIAKLIQEGATMATQTQLKLLEQETSIMLQNYGRAAFFGGEAKVAKNAGFENSSFEVGYQFVINQVKSLEGLVFSLKDMKELADKLGKQVKREVYCNGGNNGNVTLVENLVIY